MKWIKYRQLVSQINVGTEEEPVLEDVFQDMGAEYSEYNEQIIKGIAYNGEYTIEDDGEPTPVKEPTTDEILNTMLGVM